MLVNINKQIAKKSYVYAYLTKAYSYCIDCQCHPRPTYKLIIKFVISPQVYAYLTNAYLTNAY